MESIRGPTLWIKHKGIFDLNELLQVIKDFWEQDFFKVHMPKYKYKIPTPKGQQHKVNMYAERKMSEYVKFTVKIFIRAFDYKEVEIVKDGKKIKTGQGRLTVEVDGVLDLDFEKRFNGSAFLQGLQDFYHKYIIKYDICDYWEDELVLKMVGVAKLIREKCEQEAIT